MIFVITRGRGCYEDRWDQPIAVRADFITAKKVAEANIEPPGENYRLESCETRLMDYENQQYYNVQSTWRSLILPAMEGTRVYGPDIWPIEDHS